MKKIALIGSTGSIGTQTLNVVRRNPNKFKIVSLAGGNNEKLFLEQVKEFKPLVATLAKDISANYVLPKETQFYFGIKAFIKAIIKEADIVVVSLVGFLGIYAVLESIKQGKDIALANKESLVVGGEIVTKLAKEKGVNIYPIDSEHSAIWQALDFDFNKPFKRIILTASGGAFRDYKYDEIKNATKEQALKHPNWQMGDKITIDCATLVNKAYEVAEAKWLYNTTFDKIDVIIHRESIIHSMVEFNDNSVIAQMSYPTMEIPISLALSFPERLLSNVESLDFAKLSSLSFLAPSLDKYPCFNYVVNAIKKGGVYPAIVNGADEEAVSLFLQGKIKYGDIYRAICSAVEANNISYDNSMESLETANAFAINHVKNMFGV